MDRIAMIKAAALKIECEQLFKREIQRKTRSAVRRWTDEESEARAKKNKKFDDAIDKLDENHNTWTDSSKFAEEHYGDVMRDTTRWDNEWN